MPLNTASVPQVQLPPVAPVPPPHPRKNIWPFVVGGVIVLLGFAFVALNLLTDKPSVVDDGFPSASSTPAESSAVPNGQKYEYLTSGESIWLVINGEKVQTISLSGDAKSAHSIFSSVPLFLTDLDVNFDGNVDLGVFAAVGYGGVNVFYEFYIFNNQTERLAEIPEFTNGEVGISNPSVNAEKKQILSRMRSGPSWHVYTFQFNGTGYDKLEIQS